MMNLRLFKLSAFLLAASWLISATAAAQSGDTVYRSTGGAGSTKISGKIIDMSPKGIVIEVRGEPTTIASQEVRDVVYFGQSGAFVRVAERIKAGNFTQGLEELGKVDDKGNPFIAHELAFFKAIAEGNLAIKGEFGAREAGTTLNNFLTKYKKSYHFYPATELKGRLLFALDFIDLAEAEFELMSKSDWPEYFAKGHYYLAHTAIAKQQFDDAIAHCDQIISSPNNDDVTQQYQLLAKCIKAKANCLSGDSQSAQTALQQIIKVENPDNQELFAVAYNALGVCHFKNNQLKEAREKFLMTHLLMYTQSDAHAEALYYLAQIWPRLDNADQASKMRELLKSRYRNSYWAQILN